jgi:hypothetical protein
MYNAEKEGKEEEEENITSENNIVYLRVTFKENALCKFEFSIDGKVFKNIGREFKAKKGMWIGAKIGIFNIAPADSQKTGFSDYEWFRFE